MWSNNKAADAAKKAAAEAKKTAEAPKVEDQTPPADVNEAPKVENTDEAEKTDATNAPDAAKTDVDDTKQAEEQKTPAKGKFKVKHEAGALSVDGKLYQPGEKIDISEAKAKEYWIFDLLD